MLLLTVENAKEAGRTHKSTRIVVLQAVVVQLGEATPFMVCTRLVAYSSNLVVGNVSTTLGIGHMPFAWHDVDTVQ
jgi:hypothetical protein